MVDGYIRNTNKSLSLLCLSSDVIADK